MKYLLLFLALPALAVSIVSNGTQLVPGAVLAAPAAGGGSPAYPTSGLVAYWPLDDGSGTTTTDASGNGHTGTFTGSPAPTWGVGFVQFNNGGYIQIPYSSAFDVGTGDFTFSFDYSSLGVFPAERVICKDDLLDGGGIDIMFRLPSFSDTVEIYIGGTGHTFSIGGKQADATWHKYTLVRAAGVVTFYADGTLADTWTAAASINQTGASQFLFGIATGNNNPSVGKQKNVFFYNRALSAGEVLTLP